MKQYELSTTIKMLGDLLGKTIIEQEGREVFDQVEQLRGLSKAIRAGDPEAEQQIRDLMPPLVQDLKMADANLKAFSTYFQLINLAEEQQRVWILRERAREAEATSEPMDETVRAAVETLHKEGFGPEQVQQLLNEMVVVPVFTAHPTESKRRTIRQILRKISINVASLRNTDLLDSEREEIREEIRGFIVLLWQSDDTRDRRPTVMDEVRNTGLYFFENTLFKLIPRIYKEIESAIGAVYPDSDIMVPSFLKYGSWIGGDRDGNPFVTNAITEEALRAQKDLALEHYARCVFDLYEELSPALTRVQFNDDFLAGLEKDLALASAEEREGLDRFRQEPYRQKMILAFRRLQATRKQNQLGWDDHVDNPRAYASVDEFLADMYACRSSLMKNDGERLVEGRLASLIRCAETFGFHLATLDVRQHAKRHRSAVAEVFGRYGIAKDYAGISEDQKVELLTVELNSGRPLASRLDFSDETNEMLSLFRLINRAQQVNGPEAIQTYIISMTENVSNMMEVLLLANDAGLFGRIDIVPLFETVDDLLNASETMTRLFEHPVYARHLAERGNQQQIMIGYSDSNKDGGFLRANWMLYTAQQRMAQTCDEHNIRMTLFHGRGGSLGRGGGPTNRAILAQPPNSVRGRIRITEQGEVVSSRYSVPEIAYRHLQQLLHAVICSGGSRPTYDQIGQWSDVMDGLSAAAYKKYRELVDQQDFLDFFQTASPIDQIDQLNIGSRPARRKKTEVIDDLRAIPWVFAWIQSRANVPSWFGVGTGIETWVASTGLERSDAIQQLRDMHDRWPFFKTLLTNAHLGMGRADMAIAGLYAELADDNCREVYSQIREEFDRTRAAVLEITGHEELLDTEPWLQHSIRVRNPYVDPLNYLQVELLKVVREMAMVDGEANNSDEEGENYRALRRAILLSINGIAAGLQNVG